MIRIIAFISIVFCYNSIEAQIIKVYVNPFHVRGIVPLGFGGKIENKLNLKNSLELTGGIYYRESMFSEHGAYVGYNFSLASKHYFKPNELYDGFYLSPSINYLKADISYIGLTQSEFIKGTRNGFGVNISGGFQKIIKHRFSIEAALGICYYRNNEKVEFANQQNWDSWSGSLEPNLTLNVGWVIKK